MTSFALLLPLLLQVQHLFAAAFLSSSPPPIINNGIRSSTCNSPQQQLLSKSSTALFAVDEGPQEIAVTINTTLTDDKIKNLFAWVKCAFDDGEDKNRVDAYYYNNIELAIAAVFGDNLPSDSLPTKLLEMALKKEGLLEQYQQKEAIIEDEEWEEACVGDVIGRRDREQA
eukprot:scaffold10843_cov65-Skeletonema_dohrnii-CCMP3373.AAC.1